MFDWVADLWNGLVEWFQSIWDSTVEFFSDLPIITLEGLLNAIAGLLEAIPTPAFIENGLGSYLTGIDPAVLYFLDRSGFNEAVALLGVGLAFRLTRKLLTFGQW